MKLEEMKNSKIFALIAAQPYIRAVQIADAVDLSINEVEEELLPHLNRGHLVKKDVQTPNHRTAPGYAFSSEFRTTDVYAAIARSIPVKPIPSVPTSAPPPASAVAAPSGGILTSPVRVQTGEKADRQPSKAAVVIEFIRKHGPASKEQIRDLLKLKPTEHVTSVLSSAVQRRRLVKEGDLWLVGPNLTDMRCAPASGADTRCDLYEENPV